MAHYLRSIYVEDEFAKNAPLHGVIIREDVKLIDQEGVAHTAVVIKWYDPQFGGRYGSFDSKTGEYLGDDLSLETN